MAYERLNLSDGEVLTAEHIRHLEDGIEEAMNSGGGETLPAAEGVEFG